jgi:uncharacterized protein (DUF488 family)
MGSTDRTVWTIGHSTIPMDDFLALLGSAGIACIADVRSIPRSRRSPWFAGEPLAAALAGAGIRYRWLQALGGFRRPLKDSVNTCWTDPAFRGYADYMESDAFLGGMEELVRIAGTVRTAVVCAEKNPYRCHRRLIADSLTARSFLVLHIMSPAALERHRMTPCAQVEGIRIRYPAPSFPDGNRTMVRS